MVRCPRCTYPLDLYTHAEVELDHCRRCGGNFLDPGEANLLFGSHAEPERWRESHASRSLGNSDLFCPKDRHVLEAFEVVFENEKAEVDVCTHCHGMWLDRTEGQRLYDVAARAAEHARQRDSGEISPGIRSYVFQLLTGFPVEAWNPVRTRPVVVYALVTILALVFAGQLAARVLVPEWWGAHHDLFMMVPVDVLNGHHLWTIVSCAFLHGGFMHLIGNAYFLWIFGDNVEDELGPGRFLVLYAVALLSGSLLHFAFNANSDIPMLGASGAIAGVMGAYLVLFPHVKLYVMIVFVRFRIRVFWYLGFWIAYQFLMFAIGGVGVAWLAHAGGFFAGAIAAWIFKSGIDHETKKAV